jgi:hypothetical protein
MLPCYLRKHFLPIRVLLLFLAIAPFLVRETKQCRYIGGIPLCVFKAFRCCIRDREEKEGRETKE